jgi:hypothetical protein
VASPGPAGIFRGGEKEGYISEAVVSLPAFLDAALSEAKQDGENGWNAVKDYPPVFARVDDDIRCDKGGEQRRQKAYHL